jgi:hypothetical protein
MYKTLTICTAILLLLPTVSWALPIHVNHEDVPFCDPLFVPDNVHELGIAPTFSIFPDELIEAESTTTDQVACHSDDPNSPNALVEITNLTPTSWRDVWYVADVFNLTSGSGTLISNFDGFVYDADAHILFGEAFKIDAIGVNRPLVFESIAFNGIFEPGETWHFIIDDYVNFAGLAASLFNSVGVGGVSLGGPPSSGSIIAVAIPEPATFILSLIGLTTVGISRRRSGLTLLDSLSASIR